MLQTLGAAHEVGGSECGKVGRARPERAPSEPSRYFKGMSKPVFPVQGADGIQCMCSECLSPCASVFM